MNEMSGVMKRDSRIYEAFADAVAFRDAAHAAVKAFAYNRRELKRGTVSLKAPGHTAQVRYSEPNPVWRPFKARHFSLEGYEAPSIALMSFVLRTFQATKVYDVGAALGLFSLIAASTEGKSITAHAFEMTPTAHAGLLKAIKDVGAIPGRVEPHLAGLSDIDEGLKTVWFSRTNMFETKPDPSVYREALHRRIKFALQGVWNRDALHEVKLLLTSIDAMAEQTGAPEFIKIDVDGYEGKILQGARKVLTRHRPFVLLELHQDDHIVRTGWSRQAIADDLFGLGYSAIALTNHFNVAETDVVDVTRDSPMFAEQRTMMFLFY